MADAPVDPFAQQVGLTQVAGVLLDHPDQHLAERHRAAAAAVLIVRIVGGDVEAGRLGHEPLGELHLRTPCLPCLRDHLRVGNSTIEISVSQHGNGSTGIVDVTSGNNSFAGVTGFDAGTGYDLASGWGTIDAAKFVPALARFG